MRKGQIEFIAVLGIVVVIVVVAFYALNTGMIPNGTVTPDTTLVKDSAGNFIRNAVYSTLRNVSDNGGYLEPQVSDATYLGKPVTYWMRNGQTTAPDVQANIVQGINNYINSNKANFAASIRGKNVTLGQAQISVNILDNQISVSVNMPTTVNGVQVPQPYVVSVPTTIGQIITFSRGFAQQQAQNRYLEYFILSSMIMSPYDGPAQSVPVVISLTSCGDSVFKSWTDVKTPLEDTIRVTLAHTYMPDKYPLNSMATTDYLKYAIPEVGGKKNVDLNVSFVVSDDFSLDQNNFQMNPGFISLIANPIPMTGVCMSETLRVMYYIDFPTIVRVNDPLTGNSFRFAIETFIKDDAPGQWGSSGYQSTTQTEICNSKGCDASVRAVDSNGVPVQGATINYMGCKIGVTDSNGLVAAKAPCGYGPLSAYKSGFGVYTNSMSSDQVANTQISMMRVPTMNAQISEVIVENQGTFLQPGSSYDVPTSGWYLPNTALNGINPINSFADRGEIAQLSFQNIDTGQVYYRSFDSRTGSISGIPEGKYMVGGALVASDWSKIYGSISQSFNVTSSMDGTSIYVYLPYSYSFSNLDNVTQINGGLMLTSMLQKCGIGPVSTTPFSGTLPCGRTIEQL